MTRLERRAHQALVDALLEELAGERQEWYRLQAAGVRPAGARHLKEDLLRTQEVLGHLSSSTSWTA
jgi:hypothetical protein